MSGAKRLKPTVPSGFRISDKGVYRIRYDENKREKLTWICSPLEVLAYTRSHENEDWGKLLSLTDPEGRRHEWIIPASMLAKDASLVCAKLASMGLRIASDAANDIRRYLQATEPARYVRTVPRIGWYGEAFVFPDESIGPAGVETVLLQSAIEDTHLFRQAGSLQSWQQHVAYYCQGNSLLAFAVSCAFAAPLLPFGDGDLAGGFHLFASSTVGKTTILIVGGSVWGGGTKKGFVRSWKTTKNGLDNTAEGHNHALLCLDELKELGAENASTVAYSLANGEGKTRLTREAQTQRKGQWQLLFLSSGEISLATLVDELQRRLYGGQAVRFCEIPAIVSDEYGAFEKLHNFDAPGKMAQHLIEHACWKSYGTPARAFLRELTKYEPNVITTKLKRLMSEFKRQYVPNVSAEVSRAADRFALVAAGGELATKFGVTGWMEGTAFGSVATCFDAWRKARGTDGRWDDQDIIKMIRGQIFAHEESRFQWLDDDPSKPENRMHNRLGFKRKEDSTIEYLFTSESLASICKGVTLDAAVDALRRHGLLVPGEPGRLQCRPKGRALGGKRPRLYGVSSRIFEEEQAELEFTDEKVVQLGHRGRRSGSV